jgi:hypothetical protein
MRIRIINIFENIIQIKITPMFLFTSIFPEICKKLCLVPTRQIRI